MTAKPKPLVDLFPKQLQFLEAAFNNNIDVCLYGGAIRGGKTIAGLAILIILCKLYPNSKWVVVRKNYPSLRMNTIPSFNKIAPQNFIKKQYSQSTHSVVFKNDSQIIFFAENYTDDKELNRWRGLECNGFLFEELNECQEVSFYKAIERSGTHIIDNMPKSKILATCNPTQGWVKKLFYLPWKENTLRPNWRYIQSRIFDNPFIPEDYLNSLKNLPPLQYAVFVEGEWDVIYRTGGEFYKEFDIQHHVSDCTYNAYYPLHLSFDFNVNPYMTCTVYQIIGKDICQINEICLSSPKNTTKSVCNEIKRVYRDHQDVIFIYGDPAGKHEDTRSEKGHNDFTIIEIELDIFKLSRRVQSKAPSVSMRGMFINEVFRSNFEDIVISINRNCHNSIADFCHLKEASDGTKMKAKEMNDITKVSFEKHGHTSDSFDYLITSAFSSEYLKFQRGKQDKMPLYGKRQLGGKSY